MWVVGTAAQVKLSVKEGETKMNSGENACIDTD